MTLRYDADALQTMACQLLRAAGLDDPLARTVARTRIEGDLLGHDTDGLAHPSIAPMLQPLCAQSGHAFQAPV